MNECHSNKYLRVAQLQKKGTARTTEGGLVDISNLFHLHPNLGDLVPVTEPQGVGLEVLLQVEVAMLDFLQVRGHICQATPQCSSVNRSKGSDQSEKTGSEETGDRGAEEAKEEGRQGGEWEMARAQGQRMRHQQRQGKPEAEGRIQDR